VATPETQLSRTAGLRSQQPGNSPSCPSLEEQDFHQGILQEVFFGLVKSFLITFVNIALFFHMFFSQGKSGTCVPLGAQWSPKKDIVQSLEISVSQLKCQRKQLRASQKKLSTDSSSVKQVLLFIPTQSSQAPKLFTPNTWAPTSVPGTVVSSCLWDGHWGGTNKAWSRFAIF